MYASRKRTGSAPSRFLILVAVPISALIHLLLAAAWPGIDLPADQPSGSSLSVAISLGANQPATSSMSSGIGQTRSAVPGSLSQPENSAPAETTADVRSANSAQPPDPASETAPVLNDATVRSSTAPAEALAETSTSNQQTTPSTNVANSQTTSVQMTGTPVPAQEPDPLESGPTAVSVQHRVPEVMTRPISLTTQQELAEIIEQLQTTTESSLSEMVERLTTQPPEGYEISVSSLAESGPTALSSYRVTIQTELGGGLASTELTLTERPFSWYAKFINRWDADVIMANDQIVGRFHSNSPVNLETDWRARPLFAGPVTLAAHQPIGRRLRESDMFADDVETGVGRIDMPEAIVPAVFPGQGSGLQLITYDEYTQLTFLGADGFNWYQPETQRGGHQPLSDNVLIIAGTDDSRFDVAGTIHGQVAIYSPRRITITDDLVYAEQSSSSPHLLSLTSNGSIEIANPSVTGAGDLIIHGALFARQRFSVRRYNTRAQGRLHIFGTLVAGSISATEPRYTTLVEYDSRFESIRPPAFPTTGLFDMNDWDREWTITAVPDASPAGAGGIAQPLADE